MLETLFSSLMAMTGRVASSRSAPTASQTPEWALVAEEASAAVAASAAASVAAALVAAVAASAEATEAAVAVASPLEAASTTMRLLLSRPTPLPISLPRAPRGARSFTCET